MGKRRTRKRTFETSSPGTTYIAKQVIKAAPADSPLCPKRQSVEYKHHQIFSSPRVKPIWDYLVNLTVGRTNSIFEDVLITCDCEMLKLWLELLGLLIQPDSYTGDPKTAIMNILNKLIKCQTRKASLKQIKSPCVNISRPVGSLCFLFGDVDLNQVWEIGCDHRHLTSHLKQQWSIISRGSHK